MITPVFGENTSALHGSEVFVDAAAGSESKRDPRQTKHIAREK